LEEERYTLKLFYLGDRYYGFARQPKLPTIEGKIIETAKETKIIQNRPKITYASRTDRGVHAIAQTINIKTNKEPDIKKLNENLPKDIAIWAIGKTPENFNVRRHTIYRHYKYIYALKTIDIQKTTLAIERLKGIHNFKNFCHKIRRPTIRRIYYTKINRIQKNTYTFEFIGSGFARGMIRKMMDAIIQIAEKRLQLKDYIELLEDRDNMKIQLKMMPPENLYLINAYYPLKLKIEDKGVEKAEKIIEEEIQKGERNIFLKEMLKDLHKTVQETEETSKQISQLMEQ